MTPQGRFPIGARSNFIKLVAIDPLLQRSCKHVIVHTGQQYDYEMNKVLFEQLDIHALFAYSKGLVDYLAKLSVRILLVVMTHGHDILAEPDAGFGLRSSQ